MTCVYGQDSSLIETFTVSYPDSIEGRTVRTSSYSQSGLKGLSFRKFQKNVGKAIFYRTHICDERTLREMLSDLKFIKKFTLYKVEITVNRYFPDTLEYKFSYR